MSDPPPARNGVHLFAEEEAAGGWGVMLLLVLVSISITGVFAFLAWLGGPEYRLCYAALFLCLLVLSGALLLALIIGKKPVPRRIEVDTKQRSIKLVGFSRSDKFIPEAAKDYVLSFADLHSVGLRAGDALELKLGTSQGEFTVGEAMSDLEKLYNGLRGIAAQNAVAARDKRDVLATSDPFTEGIGEALGRALEAGEEPE